MSYSDAQEFTDRINNLTTSSWVDEPWQFQKINLGLIDSGFGAGNQYFSSHQTLIECLIGYGPDLFYRIAQIVNNDTIPYEQVKIIMRWLLFRNNLPNPFVKIEDSGFTGFSEIGADFDALLRDTTVTQNAFIQVMIALWQYFVRLHRWRHMYFPWNLGAAFPQSSDDTINELASTIIPAHPTRARDSSGKIDFDTYNFDPWVAPKTTTAAPRTILTDPKVTSFIQFIEAQTVGMTDSPPWDVTKIKAGLINGKSGSGDQFYSLLVHLLIYLKLAGPVFIFPITQAVESGIQWDQARTVIVTVLRETFNAFEFLADLGLGPMHWLGDKEADDPPYTGLYWQALDACENKEDFINLNVAFSEHINYYIAWVERLYPWNLFGRFQQKKDVDYVIAFNLVKAHPTPT